ncbi:MAG: hypothetical protein ACREBT_04765 [Thermoplasmata archaeon]
MEAHHRGVLDEDVFEGGEPRVELATVVVGELAERVLEATLEERRQLGSETEVERRVS